MTTSGSPPRSLLAHSQMPIPAVQCLMACIHGQPLRRRLLAGDDDVDQVAAAQARVGDVQQAVGVGRQIDPHDLGLLVDDMVDEAGILVRKAVMILPPDVRGQADS